MPTLTVDLNEGGPRTVQAPDAFTAAKPFDVELRNHGEGAHVHVRADESLSSVARVPEGNTYVDAGTSQAVRVETKAVDSSVAGHLELIVGYGAESDHVAVTVTPPEDGSGPAVDESLAEVNRDEEEESGLLPEDDDLTMPSVQTLGVLVIAAVALLLAAGAALFIDSLVVHLGVAVVVIAVIAALAQLVRGGTI